MEEDVDIPYHDKGGAYLQEQTRYQPVHRHDFIPFMLSLWQPGIGLLVLGLVYLVASLVGKA
jgi:hypothetical protein